MATLTSFTGSVPQNYDTYLGPLFFEPYATDLAERINGDAPQQILEVACGTGRITRHLVAKLGQGGELSATDLNDDMLRIARERVPDDRVTWTVADAHSLPFGDAQFDLVVCQYGVMFFGEKEKAFAEVFRVLKKGGRFLFNTWDEVKYNALAHLANDILKETFPDGSFSFIEKGPYSFFDKTLIRQLLQEAGFANITIELVAKTGIAATPDDAVTGIFDGTPISIYLQEHPEGASSARQQLRERLLQQYGEKDLQLPMQAFVCNAVKL